MADGSQYLPSASEEIRGAVQIATTAEINAGTTYGSTGARLVIPADEAATIVAANASTTVKGVVEIATDAEVAARTAVGGTGAILAMSNGYQRLGCRLIKNADQTSIGTGVVVVTWQTEQFDVGDMHSSGANTRITFPVAGVFLVGANCNHSGVATEMALSIRLNGTTNLSRVCGEQATFGVGIGTTTIYSFAANDYIEVTVEANVDANLTQAAHFEAYQLL